DNVLLCTGSTHALQLLFGCLGTSGTALLPSIGWSYYTTLTRLHGMPVASYAVAPHGTGFGVDMDSALRAIEAEDPSLVAFINPHMPTGALTGEDALLLCVAHARGSLVLVDEAYHGFSREAPTVAPHVLAHDNLVVARTFSKFFGLAGLRVGYLVAHARIVAELAKALPPFGVPGIAALVACAALGSEPYYRARADELMAVKEAFCRRVAARPRLRLYDSHGNFLLVEFPDAEAAGDAVARLHQAGVAVRSARSYGMPAFLRITVGTAETMDLVASLLEDAHGA
ncbi:MAG TPA: aminotransferase class I/II-fold pyridoxal phosphate-dependent enzyme, partial [Kofleriaceae bacterium]